MIAGVFEVGPTLECRSGASARVEASRRGKTKDTAPVDKSICPDEDLAINRIDGDVASQPIGTSWRPPAPPQRKQS